jgi:hypothetical protein
MLRRKLFAKVVLPVLVFILVNLLTAEVCHAQGAFTNPTGRPIGAGEGYGAWVSRVTTRVHDAAGLVRALNEARPGAVIYVEDDAEINLGLDEAIGQQPLWNLPLKAGVTLASGHGRNGSLGALLYNNVEEKRKTLFEISGSSVRITGLRLRGPSTVLEPPGCGRTEPYAIRMQAPGTTRWHVEIDNNEIWAWPAAGIAVFTDGSAHVHHNFIHHNRRHIRKPECSRYGLGYGVQINSGGFATIEANLFTHNRHDIASDGHPATSYTARYNLVLEGAVSSSFDVHGWGQTGSSDCDPRRDGSCIAGNTFVVHDNTFLQSVQPAVRPRGIPETGVWVFRNEFLHKSVMCPSAGGGKNCAIEQPYTNGVTPTKLFQYQNRAGVRYSPAWFVS